jgi:hypothetical protein
MGRPLWMAIHLARFSKDLALAPIPQLPGIRALKSNFIEKMFAIQANSGYVTTYGYIC